MTPSIYGPRMDDGARDDVGPEALTGVGPLGPTILVVDDDPDVRTTTRRALESYGYDVLDAGDGVEAIAALRECSGRVALVLTDVVMWRMGGAELSACVASLYPGTRLLFMSGYREEVLRRQGLLPTGAALIAKPFAPDALAATVRKFVDSGQ